MATQGGYVDVTITVKNTGEVQYSPVIGISLTGAQIIDGEWAFRATPTNPGEQVTEQLRISIPQTATPGTYTLRAKAWTSYSNPGTQSRIDNGFIVYVPGTGSLSGQLDEEVQQIEVTAAVLTLTAEITINSISQHGN